MKSKSLSLTPDSTIRSLHVGVGNRGKWPLEFANAYRFVPVGLCDTNPALLEEARQQTGLGEDVCFSDYSTALKACQPDCVIICAPTAYHVPMSLEALESGIPVIVEKGMAPDWISAQKIVKAVEQSGTPLVVAQNYRFGPIPQVVRKALTDKDFSAYLGHVHQIVWVHNRVRPNPRTLTFPFASVWDMSCHHFDNLIFWLGKIKRMQAFAWEAPWSAYPYPNNTSAHIEMESGAKVTYLHSHDASRHSEELQLHGERGALYIRDTDIEFSERPTKNFQKLDPVVVEQEEAENEGGVLRSFREWLTEGKEPGISAKNNLETMACCEMMVRSVNKGRFVERGELDA